MMDLITRLMIAVFSLFKEKIEMTYEKYCEDMKRLGHKPMSRKEFDRMMDQEKDEQIRLERGYKPKPATFDTYMENEDV